MNTLEIQDLASAHPEGKKKFRGIYPIDLLPSNKKAGIYIVNLDPSTESGSHWVALETGRKNIYFDSYGMAPRDRRLKKFLGKKYEKNLKRLQHPLSTTCGQWCLYFLLRRAQKWTTKQIVKPFKKNDRNPTLVNDYVLNFLIEKNFKVKGENKHKVINRSFLKHQLKEQIAREMQSNLERC